MPIKVTFCIYCNEESVQLVTGWQESTTSYLWMLCTAQCVLGSQQTTSGPLLRFPRLLKFWGEHYMTCLQEAQFLGTCIMYCATLLCVAGALSGCRLLKCSAAFTKHRGHLNPLLFSQRHLKLSERKYSSILSTAMHF